MSRKSVPVLKDKGGYGEESKLFERMPRIDTQGPCFKIKANKGHVHMQVYSEKGTENSEPLMLAEQFHRK